MKPFCIRKLLSVVVVVAAWNCYVWDCIIVTEARPSPGVHVNGYQELEETFYPFQQYIQVRKTYTVEHVPIYDQQEHQPTSPNLQALASSNNALNREHQHQQASSSYHDEDHNEQANYVVPRLKAEIQDYTKHEVYEEKGYGDSDYDHKSYGEEEHGRDNNYYPEDHDHEESSHAHAPSSRGHAHYRNRPLRPHVRSLHTPDGSSTKILEYVASSQHDRDADSQGIYAARDNIYCPEVIDFDLSSKSMKMGEGGRGAKPRLRGLGSKITCLKNKYFGREPLPKAIFHDPSESTGSVIEAPSFNNFFKMVRQDVDGSSSFQNSRVPI